MFVFCTDLQGVHIAYSPIPSEQNKQFQLLWNQNSKEKESYKTVYQRVLLSQRKVTNTILYNMTHLKNILS